MSARAFEPGLDPVESRQPSRRQWLGGAAGAGAAALGVAALGRPGHRRGPTSRASPGTAVKNGRIKQSLVHWCYAPYWDVPQMIKVAKQLGCGSIELLAPEVLTRC